MVDSAFNRHCSSKCKLAVTVHVLWARSSKVTFCHARLNYTLREGKISLLSKSIYKRNLMVSMVSLWQFAITFDVKMLVTSIPSPVLVSPLLAYPKWLPSCLIASGLVSCHVDEMYRPLKACNTLLHQFVNNIGVIVNTNHTERSEDCVALLWAWPNVGCRMVEWGCR